MQKVYDEVNTLDQRCIKILNDLESYKYVMSKQCLQSDSKYDN